MLRSQFSISLLATALLLAACGSDAPLESPADGEVEILTDASEIGMESLGSFNLQYDPEQNCLYHDEPDNNGEPGTGGRITVVWPVGYTARADEAGVSVLDDMGVPVAQTGEAFQIAGGAIPAVSDYCDVIGVWVANGPPIGSPQVSD